MAAAKATIETLRDEDGIAAMEHAGRLLREGLAEQARAHGFTVRQTGPVQIPWLSFAGDTTLEKGMYFAAACLRHGVYLHPWHNWFLSAAHTDKDIDAGAARAPTGPSPRPARTSATADAAPGRGAAGHRGDTALAQGRHRDHPRSPALSQRRHSAGTHGRRTRPEHRAGTGSGGHAGRPTRAAPHIAVPAADGQVAARRRDGHRSITASSVPLDAPRGRTYVPPNE